MSGKPRFIFFKTPNCKACERFEQNIWPELISDPDLSHFDFVRYIFGEINGVNHRIHDQYAFVTEVPHFALELSNGQVVKLGSFRKDRSVAGIKRHLEDARNQLGLDL